jgi:hypothetical protein
VLLRLLLPVLLLGVLLLLLVAPGTSTAAASPVMLTCKAATGTTGASVVTAGSLVVQCYI